MYTFAIPAGQLSIRPSRSDGNGCELWLNEDFIAPFESANAAAQSIAKKHTGRNEIDNAAVSLPRDVESWNWVSPRDS